MARTIKADAPAAPTAPIESTTYRARQRHGDSPSEAVTPEVATSGRAESLPTVSPAPQFVLAWHASRWIIMDGRLVPDVVPRPLSPGVSGIGMDHRTGRITFAAAQNRMAVRGWNVLAHTLGPGGSYLRRTLTDPSGNGAQVPHYHDAWTTCHRGSSQQTVDLKGKADWLDGLIKSNHIDPCPLHVAQRMLDDARAKLNRRVELAKTTEAVERSGAVQALREEIEILTDYIDTTSRTAPAAESEALVPDLGAM